MNPKIKILIAEDELEMRAVLKKTLTHEGFDVQVAANGKEALAVLNFDPNIDLLISDIRMPEKDGQQLLREALALRKDLKVLLISGYTEQELYKELLSIGACDYVTKPFKIPELLDAIDKAMRTSGR